MTAGLPSVQIAVSRAMGDAPAIGRAGESVLVDATDQVVVAAGGPTLDVLALEVAAMRRRVAVDVHLMVADEVLGGVEPAQRRSMRATMAS